jgi:hypothetical protein
MSDGVEVKVIESVEGIDLGAKPVREAAFSAKITVISYNFRIKPNFRRPINLRKFLFNHA